MLDSNLLYWSCAWVVLAMLLVWRCWRSGRGVGLLLTYVLAFGVLYWLIPTIYLLPWYDTRWHEPSVKGLEISTLGLGSLLGGAVLAEMWVSHRLRTGGPRPQRVSVDERAASFCLVVGALLYVVVSPVSRSVPSLTALTSSGSTLVVAAVAMKCWNAWRTGARRRLWRWLCATIALPFVTVVGQGYLGYGFAAMLTIFAFAANVYRPKWRVVVLGALLAYLGLSVFVTYMRDRREIRQTVWGGAALGQRIDRVTTTISEFEWFDPGDWNQLDRLDDRLNQNALLGLAEYRLSTGQVPFAQGETLIDAALAMVPRALWPGKPQAAGSGDLVSRFTGLRFMQDTSVGIGHPMECYANFGLPGVVVGFLLIGFALVIVDAGAIGALGRGDGLAFLLWYAPGLSLLTIGGSFVELTSSAAAAWLLALIVGYVARTRFKAPHLVPVGRPHLPS
jgi:hypothetical protein